VENFVIIARAENALSDAVEVLVCGAASAPVLREAMQARAKIAPARFVMHPARGNRGAATAPTGGKTAFVRGFAVKPCVVIPCFDHAATVAAVARAAQDFCPVLVVNDGSTLPLPELPGCEVIQQEHNGGKGAALRAGFKRAAELGFSHAITMDADGQHFAEDLPNFLRVAETQPDALIVGVRDFYASGCPAGRRRSNLVSTFWYRVETGVRLPEIRNADFDVIR
jgi:GT2 family glycosyltransferase